MAIVVWVILEKTKFGYELKATGLNKNAAKYCGMREKRNIILTMVIAGGLAGLGAGIFYLTGIEQWMVQQTTVPAMGFNGIAAAFLVAQARLERFFHHTLSSTSQVVVLM